MRRWLVSLAGLLCANALACSPAVQPTVILIVVDTLRADRLGAYGSSAGLTPFLDELAAKGTVFLNAYSTTSHTVPAVASLFTSRFCSQHQVNRQDAVIPQAEITLAEALHGTGYRTAGFSANFLLAHSRGYAQGFGHWWDGSGAAQEPFEEWSKRPKVRGDTIRRLAGEWLDATFASGPSSTFLYLHFMEPHAPYAPPAPYLEKRKIDGDAAQQRVRSMKTGARRQKFSADAVAALRSLYDAEVSAVDDQIRLLFSELEQRGLLAHAVVIFTADHGEELTDHDEIGHGRSLYNEIVHVPLIVLAGDRFPARIEDNVSLVDVAATVLDLIGVTAPATMEGRSLQPLLGRPRSGIASWFSQRGAGGTSTAPRAILVENERLFGNRDHRRHAAGVILGSMKLLQGGDGEELYDLAADPGEQSSGVARDAERVAQLRATLQKTAEQLQARASTQPEFKVLDEGSKEKLRALGYDP